MLKGAGRPPGPINISDGFNFRDIIQPVILFSDRCDRLQYVTKFANPDFNYQGRIRTGCILGFFTMNSAGICLAGLPYCIIFNKYLYGFL